MGKQLDQMPLYLRQVLKAMAAQDVRDVENFVQWLVAREAQRRGLLPADVADPQPAQFILKASHD